MSLPTVFTVEEANRRLPYIRSIVRDIVDLANTVKRREECLNEIRELHSDSSSSPDHSDEFEQMQQIIAGLQERLTEYEMELQVIEANLVDPHSGLIEMRSKMDDRLMWLNWIPGESEFSFWRSDDDDSTMRRPLLAGVSDSSDPFSDNLHDDK